MFPSDSHLPGPLPSRTVLLDFSVCGIWLRGPQEVNTHVAACAGLYPCQWGGSPHIIQCCPVPAPKGYSSFPVFHMTSPQTQSSLGLCLPFPWLPCLHLAQETFQRRAMEGQPRHLFLRSPQVGAAERLIWKLFQPCSLESCEDGK